MPERKKIDLLRALEVFIAAADTGSMTTAARQLKITQSAISQQLKLLESEMRVTLVDRDTRPLRLTTAGHALRHHASELLARADRLRSDVRQITAQPLDSALQEFARQSGVQVVYFSQITDGLAAPALDGRYTLEGAIRVLLGQSGLTLRVINPKTVEITQGTHR